MSGSSITVTAVPQELLERQFPTIDDAVTALQDAAKGQGYAVIKHRLYRYKTQSRAPRRQDVPCCKSGKPEAENRQRETGSRKTGCPFMVQVRRPSPTDVTWNIVVVNEGHNHPIADQFTTFPQHRKRSDEERTVIRDMTEALAKPSQIQTALNEANNRQGLQMRTTISEIYNDRKLLKKEKLGGLAPIQALLRDLEEHNEQNALDDQKYIYHFTLDEESKVDFLFFAHPLSLSMLRKNHQILILDATYKTNKYRMPLLHASGRDGLNRSYDIAFAFMKGKTTNDYIKAVGSLAAVYSGIGNSPSVIATDFDKALKAACKHHWPQSSQIICAWHMNNNILARVKLTWNEKVAEADEERASLRDKRDNFMTRWSSLVRSRTEDELQQHWLSLRETYVNQPVLLRYLENWWNVKEGWAHAYLNEVSHFGVTTTSPNEGMHAVVKQYLGRSNGDLYTVCNAIEKKIQNSVQNYNDARNRARDRPRHAHKAEPLFEELVNFVTPVALNLMSKQILFARDPNRSNVQCSGIFTRTMGLPCQHELTRNVTMHQPICLQTINPHWQFDQVIGPLPPPQTLPRLLAQEPSVIERVRGRPANDERADNSTRRDLSFFEVVDATQSRGARNSQQIGTPNSAQPQPTPPSNAQPTPTPTPSSTVQTGPASSQAATGAATSETGKKRGRPQGSKDKNPRKGKNKTRPLASEAIAGLIAELGSRDQPMTREEILANDEAMAAEDAQEADRLIMEANEPAACPSCKMALSQEEYKRDFLGKTMRQESENCYRHRLLVAQKTWKEKGYPSKIRWDSLKARALARFELIEAVISGQNCHFRRFFAAVVEKRADRFVNSAENLPTPGYYGMKGFGLLSDVIMEHFYANFRESLQRDDLIRVRGVTSFLHYVVIPEIGVSLIEEDMKLNREEALEVMAESAEVGDFFYGEVDDDSLD